LVCDIPAGDRKNDKLFTLLAGLMQKYVSMGGGRGRVKKGRCKVGGGEGGGGWRQRGGGRQGCSGGLGISDLWSPLLARRELNRKTSVSFSITGDKQKIGDSKQQKQQQQQL
jgi:hypothetical protein